MKLAIAAMVAALLLAGCRNLVDPQPDPASGAGQVRISLGGVAEASVRTVLPGLTFDHYVYTFAQNGGTGVPQAPDGSGNFTLAVGTGWKVKVDAYATSGSVSPEASGESAAFAVAETNSTTITVKLEPVTEAGATGTFKITLTYTETLDTLTLTPYAAGSVIDLTAGGITTAVEKIENNVPMGYYLLTAALTDSAGKQAGKTEVVHIYKNAATTVNWTFAAGDYTSDLGGSGVTVNFPLDDESPIGGITIGGIPQTGAVDLDKDTSETAVFAPKAGFTNFFWSVNGSQVQAGGADYTFDSASFNPGRYAVGVRAQRTADNEWLSAEGAVTVALPIAAAAITGLADPVIAVDPTTITGASLTAGAATYTVDSLTWYEADGSAITGIFDFITVYKAEIVLKADSEHRFTGTITPTTNLAAGDYPVSAVSITGTGLENTLTFTVTFPATGSAIDLSVLGTTPGVSDIQGAITAAASILSGSGSYMDPKVIPLSGLDLSWGLNLVNMYAAAANIATGSILDLSACTTTVISGNTTTVLPAAVRQHFIAIYLPATVEYFIWGGSTANTGAFAGFTNLKTISAPGLIEMDDYSFLGCDSLTEVRLGYTPPTTIGSDVFANTAGVSTHTLTIKHPVTHDATAWGLDTDTSGNWVATHTWGGYNLAPMAQGVYTP
jgi:hypothetical protein